MFLASCAKTPAPQLSPNSATNTSLPDVRAALAERYPIADVIHGGELQFEQETPINPADLPALTKALPDVRFYTTKLRTGYYEYPQVSVAVAMPKHGPIAVYLSPTYSESDSTFTEILKLDMRGQLPVPAAAGNDASAFELIRVWAAHGQQHVSLAIEVWDDPAAWGVMLVDLAKHVASAYQQTTGKEYFSAGHCRHNSAIVTNTLNVFSTLTQGRSYRLGLLAAVKLKRQTNRAIGSVRRFAEIQSSASRRSSPSEQ